MYGLKQLFNNIPNSHRHWYFWLYELHMNKIIFITDVPSVGSTQHPRISGQSLCWAHRESRDHRLFMALVVSVVQNQCRVCSIASLVALGRFKVWKQPSFQPYLADINLWQTVSASNILRSISICATLHIGRTTCTLPSHRKQRWKVSIARIWKA